MTTLDSPDILTEGRWVRDGLIVRWVGESDAEKQEALADLGMPQCGDCARYEVRKLRRGLCPACYTRNRNNGTIHRFERRRAA